MRIDFGTLAFGYSVTSGGNTPNWATSLGQGKEHKINMIPDIIELMNGVVYSSVPPSCISTKIGKGGRMVSGSDLNSPIVLGSVFSTVKVNNELIENAKFVLIITRDESESHKGRLRFKYGPSNTYKTEDAVYTNEMFYSQVRSHFHMADSACWFVYDITVYNQNELWLSAVLVNLNGPERYEDTKAWHKAWEKQIPEDIGLSGGDLVLKHPDEADIETGDNKLTPEWFSHRADLFPHYDEDAEAVRQKFVSEFSLEELKALTGEQLLLSMFLNPNNKSNLCYNLEYDRAGRDYFGSIKSGTAYKYMLFFSDKLDSWVTGTAKAPKVLSLDEAVGLGTVIRDRLVAGGEYLSKYSDDLSLADYEKIENDLLQITGGYSAKIWFIKYYALLYPELFPPIYSANAQYTVLTKLEIEPADTPVKRLFQIKEFVDECGISNVMFNKIFWSFCVPKDTVDEIDETGDKEMVNCLDYQREPRTSYVHPLNFIIYGAPGTGKTYSTAEYALAIIDNVKIEDFKANHPNRDENIKRYKEYVKTGQIVFTTFHQNYGYEEFIQGLRPDKDSETMAFKYVDGVFKTVADNALSDKENRNYVIIIDEINRANISKVFGELITLIEDDKRWGEQNEISVTLQSGDSFAVPNNLYIVGTMNSADKSISLIDAALRRRFSFIEQKPVPELVPEGILRKLFNSVNEQLADDLQSTDLLIGHSYFMRKSENDLCDVLNNSIIPLLYEYMYDNRKKVAKILQKAIDASGAKIDIVDNKIARLCVKEKVDQ